MVRCHSHPKEAKEVRISQEIRGNFRRLRWFFSKKLSKRRSDIRNSKFNH